MTNASSSSDNRRTELRDVSLIQAQLDRILQFFPRVDTKVSGLFAVNSAILTIAALNVKPADLKLWFVGIPTSALLVCLIASYAFLYRSNFPDTRGGAGSLIYFVEIQKRREDRFIRDFDECTEDEYRRDLLAQVWRNSEILNDKYRALAVAIRCTLGALIPFACLLSATAFLHSAIPQLKG